MTENIFDKREKIVKSDSKKRRRILALHNMNKLSYSNSFNYPCPSFIEMSEINLEEFFKISEQTGIPVQEETKSYTYKDSDRIEPNLFGLILYKNNNRLLCDGNIGSNNHVKHKEKNRQSIQSPSKYFQTLNIDIDYVESYLNYQGNYHNYVSKALKSLIPIRKLNYSDIVEEKKINLTELENYSKKILILDLDETLIHADLDMEFNEHDYILNFDYEGDSIHVPILLRPGLFQFLENISELFEVFVFTASKREYADAVLNYIDPHREIFKKRLYRENCINISNKIFIKDLRIFNNCKLENVVIVDNSLYSFANQLSNGVLINSFYNDKEDKELISLFNYLSHHVSNSSDIRSINEKIFNFNFILEEYVNNPFL